MNRYTIPLLCAIFALQIINAQKMEAPKAKKIPKKLEKHGDIRIDNYYWLNERENPEVIAYLEAENAYREKVMKKTEELQEELFKELKGRIKEDDTSVPYLYNDYWYQRQFKTGDEYPIYVRWKDGDEKNPQVMFDVNEMAKDFAYYHLAGANVSDNNRYAAFGVDTLSRRVYTIQIKDLETGEILSDKIEGSTGGSTWAADSKTLFYTKKDPQTLRSFQIWKHRLGSPQAEDELVFEESDETFNAYVYRTKSRKYIIIGSSATLSDEYRLIPANQPDAEPQMFQPRERKLEYSISHFNDYFYIRTNKDGAENFKIMRTPENATKKENWKDVIPVRKDVYLEGIELFNDFMVVSERKNALVRMSIYQWDQYGNFTDQYFLPFEEEVYSAYPATNISMETHQLRLSYTSLTTPSSIYEFDMKEKKMTLLKQQEVVGDFSPKNYVTERIWVTARDGKKIPVSLVRHIDTKPSKETPFLLYGYGSYGYSIDPYFSSSRLSLLDRGFIFAIAHVRGGEEMGREWYEDGKFFNKKNTFTDFIDVGKYFVKEKYTSSEHLYAMGGSAGGLLMGAIMNMEPDLWKGVIAAVPFVDVVTTMLDDSIPLTTGEYDEWGNPNDKAYYEYMKSYSPYDNVEAKDYPNTLVTTGLHDSQVQYWEPAKWVAKLRELKTDDNLLLMHCNMETGHGGASGRFEYLKEIAMEYAFLLMLEDE